MGRGRFGSQQGIHRTLAARQQAAAAVSVSPAGAIRGSLQNNGTMDLAAFSKLGDDDMAAILAEIGQYESNAELAGKHLATTDTQRFFNQIGWTKDTPQVLSDAAYEKARLALGVRSLYHTDAPYTGLTTKQMLDQFRKGTQYLSGGVHGDGTYLAEDAADSWSYGNGNSTARQQKMFFNRNARIIDESVLVQKINTWKVHHPKTYTQLRLLRQGRVDGNLSIYAAMFGYNVIKSYDYYAVLNRKAVTVAKSHQEYGRMRFRGNW